MPAFTAARRATLAWALALAASLAASTPPAAPSEVVAKFWMIDATTDATPERGGVAGPNPITRDGMPAPSC
jgi:hypothetical protein